MPANVNIAQEVCFCMGRNARPLCCQGLRLPQGRLTGEKDYSGAFQQFLFLLETDERAIERERTMKNGE